MSSNVLNPGYLRWDGFKYTLDSDVEITGPAGPPGLVGPVGPAGPAGISSFTYVTSPYTQPTQYNSVDVDVADTSWMSEGQIVFVQGAGYYSVNTVSSPTVVILTNLGYIGPVLYTYPPPNTTINSGIAVIPAASQSESSIVFNSVNTMLNTDTTYFLNGTKVMVTFPRSMTCVLDKNSTIIADNLRYFAATPSGIWIRDIAAGAPGACEVLNWYVSSSVGNDNNDGLTNITALASIEELQYRIGNQPIDGNTVGIVFVNLLSDFNDGRQYSFNFNFIHDGGIAFIGQKNIQATHIISSVTQWDEITGVIGAYTLTGSPNLSSNVGMFARISASANSSAIGRKTLIVRTPSTGVFNGNFIDQSTTLVAEPIVGDTIQIYTLTKLGGNIVINSNPVVFNSGGGIYFQDVDMGIVGSNHSVTIGSGSVSCIACILRGCDVQPGVNQLSLTVCATYDLRAYSFLTLYGTIMQSGGGALLDVRNNATANSYTRSWVYGNTFSIGNASDGGGMFCAVGPFVVSHVNSVNNNAIIVFNRSNLVIGSKFLIIESPSLTNGFYVRPGGGIYYPSATTPIFSGTLPTNKFKIGSTVTSTLGSGIRDTNSSAEMVPGDV